MARKQERSAPSDIIRDMIPPDPVSSPRYAVVVSPRHPTGVYHRAGLTFSRGEPTLLTEVPEAIKNDGWLIVTEATAENAQN